MNSQYLVSSPWLNIVILVPENIHSFLNKVKVVLKDFFFRLNHLQKKFWIVFFDMQTCTMCVGFHDCLKIQLQARRYYFFLSQIFYQKSNIFLHFFQELLSGFVVAVSILHFRLTTT